MYIKNLKTRPKKKQNFVPCAPQLVALLGCWAANNDPMSMGACAEVATTLHSCMHTAPKGVRRPVNDINYHLARLQKYFK